VPIEINGQYAAQGSPGTYCALTRTWSDGDTVTFTLPLGFRSTKYHGADTVPGFDRYAIEYGPILLGVVGNLDFRGKYMRIFHDPLNPADWLIPIPGKPGHFSIQDKPGYELMPYYEIQDELFSCYPVIGV
jgi:hypothetical protein